ncbi:hypothetical protein MN032_10420 [Agromyces atrinae]|uniref:hypothetical protein n=1 Tax=Agromyces atrinae TaxID=592376 RepID=UPI001F59DFFA|nr:hypothetical protein [Agromyces atrinae]MCI2958110.1 hypothetical protein [Agromyces atrinae]
MRLEPRIETHGLAGVDYIDQPTFVILPHPIAQDVRIDVDIRSGLRPNAPDYARGFAGVAFRISPDARRFEAVYLRPLNGTRTGVAEPRRSRGVQYFSYPDWPFDRLRDERADEVFEAPADIAPDDWVSLRVEAHGDRVTAQIGAGPLIEFSRLDPAPAGRIGLWVDIGTDALFSDLRITPL